MLEAGKKVKIIDSKDSRYGEIGVIQTIRDGYYLYPIIVKFKTGYIDFGYYEEKNLELYNEVEIERTNRIKRVSGSGRESVIEWNVIDNKNIEIRVKNNPVNLVTLLKIILRETALYDYKYHRVSPYKIVKEYDTLRCGHVYSMEFIDIKDDFKVKKNEVLITDRSMSIEGALNLFIPDMLEICVERSLLKRNGDGYILNRNLDGVTDYIYLKNKPSIRTLEMNGFIITEEYRSIV
jgi:hypothetical protein